MKKITRQLCEIALQLSEYERKQIICILVASMLSEISYKDAHNSYNEIIKALKKNID